ncbi:MAG: isoamylase early set domain-containing protein [Ginsengibacter sp.]
MTKSITFSLPAEALQGATEVFLLGDFNNWNPENAPKLEKQQDGSYKTAAELEEGKTYQYRFLLNDGRWVNDYHAQKYVPVEGLYVDNCVITVPESKTEENKKAVTKKRAPNNTNVVKAEPGEESTTNKKSAGSKSPKKITTKTKAAKAAPKTKKSKSASADDLNQKVVGSTSEKKEEKE